MYQKFKVKVVKTWRPDVWYKDLVGEEYVVINKGNELYEYNVIEGYIPKRLESIFIPGTQPLIKEEDCVMIDMVHYKISEHKFKL